MSSSRKRNVWLGILCLSVCVVFLFVGVAFAAEDQKSKEATPPAEKKADDAKKTDPFVVPDGTPEELFAYLKSLNTLKPEGNDQATLIKFFKKIFGAQMEACEKILASNAPADKKKTAAIVLFRASQQLAKGFAKGFADSKAIDTITRVPKIAQELNFPQLEQAANALLIEMNIKRAEEKVSGAPSLAEVLDQFKSMVEKNPDGASLNLVITAVASLYRNNDETIKLCDWATKVFGDSKNEKVLERLKYIEGTTRRLKLVGNPVTIKGKTLDGKPYDLADQKGKVVLVQFWATWCGPCLKELPNVEKSYKLYHDRGFEIVGVSIDHDKAKLDEFLKNQPLPWPIISDSEEANLNAKYYGVLNIPQLILVDKQGKAVSISARGPELDKELEKLLGPVEKKAADAAKK